MSTVKANTLTNSAGTGGTAIKGIQTGTPIPAGDRGEYGITQMTSNVVIANANTTLLAMVLTSGAYMIGYDLCAEMTTGAAAKFHIQAAGSHVTYSAAYVSGPASGSLSQSVSRRVFVDIATTTSYDLMVDGAADSSGNVFANGNLSANITDPDNASTFWFVRR